LNKAFCIPREELEDRLHVSLDGRQNGGYHAIVPLREIVSIDDISVFKVEVLNALVRNIPLRSPEGIVYPYADARIQQFRTEPGGLYVGQTFVLDAKVLSIMHNLRGCFESHCMPGLSKMGPVQVYGVTKSGDRAIAIYVPPIVEKHGDHSVILDGIHRSYICRSGGTTITAIHVSNVGAPLPFDPIQWSSVNMVHAKPPIEERYVNLRRELFRDLTTVGIDG